MKTTPHLGKDGVHPVVAAAAQELLNKSDNERSGVLSTAMSFLGLYRDPVIAQVTGASDWRITDLVDSAAPVSLYLVIPPSDISRTKPLVRLMLNQIGRRLTEELRAKGRRQRVMFMLDEFPALGRLDFFESALAFVAGYGIKAFLIAQSLNQIEKAYGSNNAILDNCHVRVAFATNDERTAKRISDSLGTATEMRAMKNYAGHRLSPWLGHLMVSRTETPRPLLTPGEVMQLPPNEEIVMVSGMPPLRATKARYFEDKRFTARLLPPPEAAALGDGKPPPDDWSDRATIAVPVAKPLSPDSPSPGLLANGVQTIVAGQPKDEEPADRPSRVDNANAGIRREPDLPEQEEIVPPRPSARAEFEFHESDDDNDAARARAMKRMHRAARQASLDPDDGVEL